MNAAVLDLQNAETDLRAARRQMAILKAKVRKDREESDQWSTAKALYDFWVKETGRNPNRCVFTEDRQKLVFAQLNAGRDPAQIRDAIRGAAKFPYTKDLKGNIGRSAHGPKSAKYDDLETICRTRTLEKLASLVSQNGTGPAHEIIEGLRALGCEYVPVGQEDWLAQCPVCSFNQPDKLTLSVTGKGHIRCENNCSQAILAELLATAAALEIP